VNFGFRAEIFSKAFYRIGSEQPRDLTARIVHVSDFDGVGTHTRAGLNAGWRHALIQAMRAEVTRFSDAVRSFRTFGIGPIWILFEVESPLIVGTGNHAVPASDAPVVVDDDDPVFTLVSGLYRTNLSAWWIFTMIAQQEHRFLDGIMDVFFFDAYLSNPVNVVPFIAKKSDIVFFAASFRTCVAVRQAFVEIDNHSPFETLQRTSFAGVGLTATGQQG